MIVAGEPDFQFIVACNVFIHLTVASISFYKTYLHIFFKEFFPPKETLFFKSFFVLIIYKFFVILPMLILSL